MNRVLLILLVAFGLIVAGCGGDDGGSTSEAASNPGGTLTQEDAAEVEDTVKTWMLEGGCDNMTDGFLEDQTFISEPDKACEAFENIFSAPSYSADDIIVSDIKGDDDKASLVVSDDFSNVRSTYRLVNEGGDWKIDSVDIS